MEPKDGDPMVDALGFSPERCGDCGAHLYPSDLDGRLICLNGCRLGKAGKGRFLDHLRKTFRELGIGPEGVPVLEEEAKGGESKQTGVKVRLSGEDGNIFAIMGRVALAMRRAGVPAEINEAYQKEMLAAESYDAALQVTMSYVDVE